ncbi:family 1 glycosylhydrolase [Kineococcus sp. R8]|uniref:family 1 glycosylhydrolase n=1 Tax=Kineococcus siccus TaxID=2696567 RepID=UPI001412BD90|nr:family 1 glycosylhydrolase [Kineococcus siccus]NAZ80780.1 family 1 glycosylhydrolase [Kineococcus siccus]
MRWHEDGRLHFALGIEDTFVPQEAAGERAVDEYELTEHYAHVASDLGLAQQAGADLLRWGIPWHRVNPGPEEWDWAWVDQAMARFADLGLEPVVDLLHYGTPLWLDEQFANPDFPRRFAAYAERVADRYGHVATSYTPVNEPMIHAQFSGEYGYWPPYLRGRGGLLQIAAALADASAQAQRRIAGVLGDAAVFVHVDAGFRYAGDVDAPEHAGHVRALLEQRYLVEDLLTGRVGPEHPLHADLLGAGVGPALLEQLRAEPAPPTVMGVNYYPLHSTEVFERGVHHRGGFADPRPTRDDGVLGLREVLTAYEDRYDVPVMLTETCVTASAEERIRWLRDSVAELHALRAEGRRVLGYTWWPLFDMYEWTYRHSTRPRRDHLLTMGLYDLVETSSGLARVRNPVEEEFRRLAAEALALAPGGAAVVS